MKNIQFLAIAFVLAAWTPSVNAQNVCASNSGQITLLNRSSVDLYLVIDDYCSMTIARARNGQITETVSVGEHFLEAVEFCNAETVFVSARLNVECGDLHNWTITDE